MVGVANFARGLYQAFLREHVLFLIHEMHKQQSNTAWGRWGGCQGCINNAPKWGLVCTMVHTSTIWESSIIELVCTMVHTKSWGDLIEWSGILLPAVGPIKACGWFDQNQM